MTRMIKKRVALPEPTDLVQEVQKNYDAACTMRENWVGVWQDCYDLTLPELARFRAVSSGSPSRRASLYDGTAPDAVDQLAASLLGHLTPPWVNWVGLSAGADVPQVAKEKVIQALALSTTVLQDQIDRSNLHVELHQCFVDLVIGGTACLQILENKIGADTAVRFRAIPLSEIVLGPDADGAPANVYRMRVMTGAEIVRFGDHLDPMILDHFIQSQDQPFDVLEFCERDGEGYRMGAMVMMSGHDPVLLSVVTRAASPFIVFRWMKTPGDSYGRSPVMKTLPDIKTANKVVELVLKNASIAVTGIWQAEDDGVLNPANIELIPGAIIPKAVGSAGLKPLEMPARFDVSQLVLSDLRARIRHALLVDRFAQLESQRLTATEVRERADEATLILGAVYGRLQSELMTPLVTYIYDILRARGEVANLPLDGRIVQIAHRSPLARAQSARAAQGILAWVGAAASLGDGAMNSLNGPAIVAHLAETLGVPETFITRLPDLQPISEQV